MSIYNLQPAILWRHFKTIADIPHPSGSELVLRDHLREWAHSRGLETVLDHGGNLIIRKPATVGMEDRLGVILQAHLDMVSQKNSGHPHDFLHDSLNLVAQDGWVRADGTTLGADNGIGVAAAMAVLEDDSVCHGPLEVLLTLDEEAGMTGARALETGFLTGPLLFNLDTEEWGEVYVGCAGGVDLTVSKSLSCEEVPVDWEVYDIALTGLKGGHSGCDIHLGRANAVQLLALILRGQLIRMVKLNAGTVRNAIPREAFATIAIPAGQGAALEAASAVMLAQFQAMFAGAEHEISLEIGRVGRVDFALTQIATEQVIDLLLALPSGVARFSQAVPGVVETSNNLGVVAVSLERFEAILLARSLVATGMADMVSRVKAVARLAGAQCDEANAYPGWQPDLSSRALAVVMRAYRGEFGIEPAIKVIHAGLECGLIGAVYPDLEMVSFGPTIRNAHSPTECVEIESVAQFWQLLKVSLAGVPRR